MKTASSSSRKTEPNHESGWFNGSRVDVRCSKRCWSLLKANDNPCGVSNLAKPHTSISSRAENKKKNSVWGALQYRTRCLTEFNKACKPPRSSDPVSMTVIEAFHHTAQQVIPKDRSVGIVNQMQLSFLS